MTGHAKLIQLRLKTDRELIQLISNELNLGIREARQALESGGEDHYRMAKRAYAEASLLVSLAREVRSEEPGGTQTRLEGLHEILEALSNPGSRQPPTEDHIAALARALWKARGCVDGLPEEDWFRAERILRRRVEPEAACVGC